MQARKAQAAPEMMRDFVAPVLERTEETARVAKEEVKQRRQQVEASLREDAIHLKAQAKLNLEKVRVFGAACER